MNDQKLDDLLVDLARERIPELPGSFSQDVLREIRLRQDHTEEKDSWFGAVLHPWLWPRVFAVSLTAAVTMGLVLPLAVLGNNASMAISSLDLNVFSNFTPNLPSGLLSRIR
jgi:hypothetical protein